MLSTYNHPEFDYIQSTDQKNSKVVRHPVIIIGAGPMGLTAGLELAAQGIPAVILDDNNTVSVGSRAVCYAKRPLEIWDRLGVAEPMVAKGINWKIGKVFFKDQLAYQFDLLPEQDHKMPAMINLQQYHVEEYLVRMCEANTQVDLRWKHKLLNITQHTDYASLEVETPDGIFTVEADWVIACDGANSDTRKMVDGEFSGQFFKDRFLIADIVMKNDFPTERWFWFDPIFHPNQSALLHKQPDDVWRLDFQLGWDADPEAAKKPENLLPLLHKMLGEDVEFELEWVSVYQFACRRMDKFRYSRVLFAGDSAHQVSPFGARGANTGVQDIDNLCWKLKLVIEDNAPIELLDTYCEERVFAADDNLQASTRSTDFITPKSKSSRLFRDAVLLLAQDHEFARPLVNSGRLSMPTPYLDSSLNTVDGDEFSGDMKPGTNCADAPIQINGSDQWFLNQLGGKFKIVTFGNDIGDESSNVSAISQLSQARISADVIRVGKDITDHSELLTQRYDGKPGTTYLIRPDQHVAARWRSFDSSKIKAAIAKATCQINQEITA